MATAPAWTMSPPHDEPGHPVALAHQPLHTALADHEPAPLPLGRRADRAIEEPTVHARGHPRVDGAVHGRQRREELARLGVADLVQVAGLRQPAAALPLEDDPSGVREGLDLLVRDRDHQLAALRVAGVAGLLGAQPFDERGVVVDGLGGETEPRVRIAAVRLRRQDAGAGVGGAADVRTVHQQRARAGADEVVGSGHPEEAAADDGCIEGHGGFYLGRLAR